MAHVKVANKTFESQPLSAFLSSCARFAQLNGLPKEFDLVLHLNRENATEFENTTTHLKAAIWCKNLPVLTSAQSQRLSAFVSTLRQWFKTTTLEPIDGLNQVAFILMQATTEEKNIPPALSDASQSQSPVSEKAKDAEQLATFTAIDPKYRLDQMILPEALKSDILTSLEILKNNKLIYEEWGFQEIDPVVRASLNFYGPPGTGKTMAAHAIAHELGCKILVANLAEIVSKYMGDSPKNLTNLFATAKETGALLFFDEADSFLGKRLSSVSDAAGQSLNSLRSHLLQLLENHSGIVIFCTNLVGNYDKAFESRILRSLHFTLPDETARTEIIKKMIPSKVPFENGTRPTDEEFLDLAKIADGFSGREIKNAVLQALSTVVSEKRRTFTLEDFKKAFTKRHDELEQLHKAQGKLTGDRAKELSKKIADNLQNQETTTVNTTLEKDTANASPEEMNSDDKDEVANV